TLDRYIDSADVIFERVMVMYDEFDGLGGIDFVSVTMSNLVYKDEMVEQLNIFEDLKEPTVKEILNRLNESMNGAVFMTSRQLLEKDKS
ncbi:MAG: DNA polymerase IV, partial [Erysipelothrix sp.]|nr:DNA polymerase IV [Erysipelothrix sp.]